LHTFSIDWLQSHAACCNARSRTPVRAYCRRWAQDAR